MGCGYAQALIKEIKNDIENADKGIYEFESFGKQLRNSIKVNKNNILKNIEKGNDLKLIGEIEKYYQTLDKVNSNDRKISVSKDKKNNLENLLKKIEDKTKKKTNEQIVREYGQINKKFSDSFGFEDKAIKEQNKNKLEKIKEFQELNDEIKNELEKISKRKEEFKQKIDKRKKDSNLFSIEESIDKKLKNYENNIDEIKNKLNSDKNQIKTIIKDILENTQLDEINIESKYSPDYDQIKNEIININLNQDKLEENILKEVDNDIKIATKKKQISSKMSELNSIINQVTNNINDLENKKQEYNGLNELINQKENKQDFVSFQIKDKMEQIKKLQNERNDLNLRINTLTNQINEINRITHSFNELENLFSDKNDTNPNNYLNDKIYNERVKKIEDIKDLTKKELNNIEKIKRENKDSSNKRKDIEELIKDKSFILYNSEDEENNNEDNYDGTYVKFKNKVKDLFNEIYYNNPTLIDNIIKSLLNNDGFDSIPTIENNIINQIFKNEKFNLLCENDLISELESISKDDEKFKINHLTILLIGRKDVGKTTLIKYLLKLNDDEINRTINNKRNKNEFFIPFTSTKVKYLKIIEVRGIGFDKNSTPENIKREIENYVKKNKNDFNSVIHCIWFCIHGTRFEKPEESLFFSLKNLYEENIMPMILIYTKSTDQDRFNEMKKYLMDKNIENDIVEVVAQDIPLMDKTIKKAFGNEKLLEITKKNCIKALDSDMFKIMVEKISNNLLDNFFKKYEKIVQSIKEKVFNDFVNNYKESLGDEDFIQYIIDIFLKNLNKFFDSGKEVTNKSRNLFLRTDFISSIHKIYSLYKKNIKNDIKSIVEINAKELLDIQASFEIEFGNIESSKRRNYEELKKIIEIFLKNNYYFLVQNYIINFLVNKSNIHLNNFLSLFLDKLKSNFHALENLNKNNNNDESVKIRKYLEKCLKEKLNSFYKNNIELLNYEELKDSKEDDNQIIFDKNEIKYEDDENLEKIISNSDSLIFKKFKIQVNDKPENNMYIEFDFNDHKSNILKQKKLQTFVKKIQSQNSSLPSDDQDKIFNYLKKKIKNNLLEYIKSNQGKFFNELIFQYNNNFNKKNNNKFLDNDKIENIIINNSSEQYFQNQVQNSLNDIPNKDNQQLIKLNQLTLILEGKSGVGKSTLINSLLREDITKTGVGNVVTLQIESFKNDKVPFLNLIDSRGYELKQEFNPNKIKDDIIKYISGQQNSNEINEFVHCIWYCVSNCNSLDKTEINALKELKNNKYNIPLIVIFTNAQIKNDIDDIKEQIINLFSEDIFVPVLGKSTKDISEFGLDDLLNKTLDIIKSNNKNSNILEKVKDINKNSQKQKFRDMFKKDKEDTINKIIEDFMNNYTSIKSEYDFKLYVCGLITKIIQTFGNKNQLNSQSGDLIQSIKSYIDSCITFYKKIARNYYLGEFLDKKSFEFLQLQVNVEQEKNGSIKQENKKNRKGFKELIFRFLNDNFYYIAQKYLIYKYIIDIIEDLAEKLEKITIKKIDDIIEGDKLNDCYRNIYLNVFSELEKKISQYIDEYRDKKNKFK